MSVSLGCDTHRPLTEHHPVDRRFVRDAEVVPTGAMMLFLIAGDAAAGEPASGRALERPMPSHSEPQLYDPDAAPTQYTNQPM